MVRAPCCEKMGLKKGPWTHEEDQILITYINLYGHDNWRALPKQAGLLRCGKSCRLRWTNYLRPDIKRGNFSREEEDNIIELHEMLGNRQPELGRQLEQLENQPDRLGRQPELPWSTENSAVVLAAIAAQIALAEAMFQNASDNRFHSRPATTIFIFITLSIYGFAAARTRPIILDGKQQILMWRFTFTYYYYRLLNSLVLISKVVCQACIASLFIPYGPGWNFYVACASTSCFGVTVCAILWNFAPSFVVWLVPCMGPTRSSGGSEKNDGVSDCGNDGSFRIAGSNGSPVCGSSLVSENQSSSQQGGTTSSDAGSHSGHFKVEQSQLKHTCEHGVPSHQTDHSTQANGKTTNTGNAVSPHIIQSSPNKGTTSKAHPDPDEKPIQSPNPLKAAGGHLMCGGT